MPAWQRRLAEKARSFSPATGAVDDCCVGVSPFDRPFAREMKRLNVRPLGRAQCVTGAIGA